VTANVTAIKHWLPVRFVKLGKMRLDFLQEIITAESYTVMQFDCDFSRAPTAVTQEMMKVWIEDLKIQIESKGKRVTPLHEWLHEEIDDLSIFGDSIDIFEHMCADNGVASMPNLDKLAEISYDILSDMYFASAMVGILKCKPRLVVIAPECTVCSTAQHFNARNMSAKSALKSKKVEQEKIMRRIRKILNAVRSYGRHAIIDNP
jgi:hypothetical protein